jgi:predicted transposase/invertase (TIGR01784 family)
LGLTAVSVERTMVIDAEVKGITKGKEEEKKIMALKMLKKGMEIKEVSELTELSLEDVKSLLV